MQLTPYLMFNGNCEEALNFYAHSLNGQIKDLMRFEGSPAEDMSSDKNGVMHSNFEAGEIFFMASDTSQATGEPINTCGVHLSINFATAEEEEFVFIALADGGKVTMPLQETFWGARFGMLTDKFGINWMFNFDKPQG
jgi:PhnB protein